MSVYNPKYNTLFIHVPKTAGTSMERREFLGSGGHQRVRHYMGESFFTGAFKFAFVRNPWDRLASTFFHQSNLTRWEQTKVGFHSFITWAASVGFDEDLMYPEPGRWPLHHHFLPQYFFVTDEEGEVVVDFLGRYENLQQDWKWVCDRVGVPDTLPHLRRGAHAPYREYYTPEDYRLVRNLYERDIELFKYT